MRNQRREPLSVELVDVTVVRSDLGNETSSDDAESIANATFEPERILERSGTQQARVVQPASFNLPGVHNLNADALLRCEGQTWRVVGGSTVWLDRTNVPVVKAGAK